MNDLLEKESIKRKLESWGTCSSTGQPLASALKRSVVAIVPAAGRGTRLDFDGPKALYPVQGKTILERIYEVLGEFCQEVCLVVSPAHHGVIDEFIHRHTLKIRLAVQEEPQGMGDAILSAESAVSGYDRGKCDYLIVWGDQATVRRETILGCLLVHQHYEPAPALTFPTCRLEQPYIHFARDRQGRIVSLLQRREGDAMPVVGENDCGVFVVRGKGFFSRLSDCRAQISPGKATGEFNFLPYIVWLGQRGETALGLPIARPGETRGINTAEDARLTLEEDA